MYRSFVSVRASDVGKSSNAELYGQLAGKLSFAVDPAQRSAWNFQIAHLRELAKELPGAHFSMEFLIPRMGRRADLIILYSGVVFVVEYKVGSNTFDRSSINQTYGYDLDLKHFHEPSHDLAIVPILVATGATVEKENAIEWDADHLAQPLCVSSSGLAAKIKEVSDGSKLDHCIDPQTWLAGRYRPTPTIVEAAQALYSGHDVEEISRSEAGAENLTKTADYVSGVIENAKATNSKTICFITGVPGSGKTLAGLYLATARQRSNSDEHAVFLSGNGPLVAVLREALAADIEKPT